VKEIKSCVGWKKKKELLEELDQIGKMMTGLIETQNAAKIRHFLYVE